MDEYHCSFCGKRRIEVRRLISGPRVFICEGCVALCVQIIDQEGERKKAAAASDAASGDEKQPEDPSKPPPSCNFCGKLQKEVESMIAGPTIYICNECVGLCVEIVEGRA